MGGAENNFGEAFAPSCPPPAAATVSHPSRHRLLAAEQLFSKLKINMKNYIFKFHNGTGKIECISYRTYAAPSLCRKISIGSVDILTSNFPLSFQVVREPLPFAYH